MEQLNFEESAPRYEDGAMLETEYLETARPLPRKRISPAARKLQQLRKAVARRKLEEWRENQELYELVHEVWDETPPREHPKVGLIA